jgi:uncharacterized RDD family membrane protein YckC
MNPPQGGPMPPQQPAGGGGQMPSWTNNITARGTIGGPGGVALADLPDRIIAIVIDAIIIGVVGYIISFLLGTILTEDKFGNVFGVVVPLGRGPSFLGQLIALVLSAAVSAGYFIYMWTRMGGATVGMRVQKITVRDAATGGPVSQGQAINRWLALGLPQVLSYLYWALGAIGFIIGLVVLGYYIYLLMTTAQSPTRQGWHDKFAKTVVAKG